MKPRTEDDIISRAPLVVRLGASDFNIPLLPVTPQREWRKKLFAELVPIIASFNFQVDGQSMTTGLTAALLHFPDKLAELVFAYSPELPQAEILLPANGVTEEQIATAFSAIMGVAFPFLPQLGLVTQMLRTTIASLPR